MIPHHQEAIATAQQLLNYSDRPEMHEFARSIIAMQSNRNRPNAYQISAELLVTVDILFHEIFQLRNIALKPHFFCLTNGFFS